MDENFSSLLQTNSKPMVGRPSIWTHTGLDSSFAADANHDGSKQLPNEFHRIEDKYIVPKKCQDELFRYLKNHLPFAYPDQKTTYTLIESIYFDGPEFSFFQEHFEKLPRRCKLRARIYGPEGVWNHENILMELKEKIAGVGHKFRFSISQDKFENFLLGGKIVVDQNLIDLNPDLLKESLEERVFRVNQLVKTKKLKPKLRVRYQRLAFGDHQFRATLDTDLQYTMFDTSDDQIDEKMVIQILKDERVRVGVELIESKFNEDNSDAILELKHAGEIPRWMQDLLTQLQIEKTSFSKYCWSVGHLIKDQKIC
jgi:SPX domain protein involved in polyphosphate accumulation